MEVGIADHMYSDILQSVPFRSQILKIFFVSSGNGALTPQPKSRGRPCKTMLPGLLARANNTVIISITANRRSGMFICN